MKRLMLVASAMLAVAAWTSESAGRGFGGGGRGGARPGGGVQRPATPSFGGGGGRDFGGGGRGVGIGGGNGGFNRPQTGFNGNRPGGGLNGNRPGGGIGGNRPDGGIGGNRPNGGIGGNRPNGALGGFNGNRPGGGINGNRPGGSINGFNGGFNGNRPDNGFRPNDGYRPGQWPPGNINRPNVNQPNNINNNPNRTNNINNVSGNTINRTVNRTGVNNFNNSFNGNRNNWGPRPNYWHYNNWHNGYWNWRTWPVGWVGAVPVGGWLFPPGDTYVYSNPYYVESTTVQAPASNYSQPIPTPPQDQAPPAEDDPTMQSVNKYFDAARAAFKQGDYDTALTQINQAIKLLPNDPDLHEFRATVYFAQGKYGPAAAAVYAVLASGPGWNWETLRSLYPDTATYTKQLRALEDVVKKNPDQADTHFLLAYEYLVLGYQDNAKTQLQHVVRLKPDDKLSAQLLQALSQPPSSSAAPAPNPGS